MAPVLIPREILFGNPERTSPQLSPDGTQLAWIAPRDGVLNVYVAPVAGGAVAGGGAGGVDWAAARPVTHDTDRGVRGFLWEPDGRRIGYIQDRGGDENWRLYDVELTTLERRDLTPFEGVQVQLIAAHPSRPDAVLVGLNRDDPQLHDVYRLDLRSGALEKIVANPGVVSWLADSNLTVRAAVAPSPDGSLTVVVPEGEGWRPIIEVPADDALATDLLAVSADGETMLLLSSVGAEAARLLRCSLSSGETLEVLAADPRYDVGAVRLHPVTNAPQLAIVNKDRDDYVVLDPSVAGDLEAIRAVEPGDPVFLGGDDADRTWLVGFTNDDGPVRFYAYDRASRRASLLFEHQPALSRYGLAHMEPFSFVSRDGLEVHGYATFPPGAGRASLPTVLNVHGGPWARDAWGFHPEAQWLANRGYLCLQVNFRGSTGYGKSFLNAGDREWGAKMHDDLVDAVRFAAAQGWSDPARVAIFGGSYGGYAALVGATFTPEVFCCAVDIVGPSNLKTLIETIPPYWVPMIAQFHRRVGNPETDAEFMWSRSPLSRVDQIRIPMLIAQGANDPRVKQAESEQIVAAMRDAGIEHEYLLFPDEGHGFAKPENRLRFYAAAEAFLARHLGGRSEP